MKWKLTWIQKLGLAILGLLLITFFIKHVTEKWKELRVKRMDYAKTKLGHEWSEKIKKLDAMLEGGLDENGNIKEGFDILDDLFVIGVETVEAVGNFIASMAGIIEAIAVGFTNILLIMSIVSMVVTLSTTISTGIHNHIICGSTEFNSGFENSVQTTIILAQCSWDKFTKFWNGNCTRYYLSDLIFGLLYGVLIELPIVIIYAIFGLDLQPLVDFIYEIAVVPLDELIYAFSGFHIIMWSPDVVQQCYRCTGTYNVDGQTYTFSKPFNEWAATFKCSGAQMKHGIVKVLQSIVPSPKWTAWLQGEHLDGGDDNPPFQ